MGWVNSVRRCCRLPYAWVANRLSAPILVLLYHRVCELPQDPHALAVSPQNFRDHMEWLRARFPIVTFDQDWSSLKEPGVCITFDDGYADNVTNALPILEELGLHATFFITTGMIDSDREFWWDELEQLLASGAETPPQLSLQHGSTRLVLDTATPTDRQHSYRVLHTLLRPLIHSEQQHLLENIRHWAGHTAGTARASHRTLSRTQLHRLAMSPSAAIGAHCLEHNVLARLAPADQRTQIQASQARLSNLTAQPVTTFAYPYGGRHDFNRASLDICREIGFRRVAANIPGLAYPWTNAMRIPRQVVRDWPIARFERWMQWAWLR